MDPNKQKYISFIVIIIVIILAVFLFLKGKKVNAPADDMGVEIQDSVIPKEEGSKASFLNETENPDEEGSKASFLTTEQNTLLAKLQKSVDARDFESFASFLQEVYKNQWDNIKELIKAESDMYVYATDIYFVKGDLENSLKISTIVYNKVPQAWRFRYLRIVTLEKYGRKAFESKDLVQAEKYANTILQMMFRPEGANLLADVYISRIATNIKDGKMDMAKQNLNFIWDYEVDAGRRDILNEFKRQIGNLTPP